MMAHIIRHQRLFTQAEWIYGVLGMSRMLIIERCVFIFSGPEALHEMGSNAKKLVIFELGTGSPRAAPSRCHSGSGRLCRSLVYQSENTIHLKSTVRTKHTLSTISILAKHQNCSISAANFSPYRGMKNQAEQLRFSPHRVINSRDNKTLSPSFSFIRHCVEVQRHNPSVTS